LNALIWQLKAVCYCGGELDNFIAGLGSVSCQHNSLFSPLYDIIFPLKQNLKLSELENSTSAGVAGRPRQLICPFINYKHISDAILSFNQSLALERVLYKVIPHLYKSNNYLIML